MISEKKGEFCGRAGSCRDECMRPITKQTGFSLVMGLPGARATTVVLLPSSACGRGVERKHQGTLNRFLDAA